VRKILLLSCALVSSPHACRAAGAEYDAALGKTGTGRCHMDVCSFFQIQTAMPLAVLKDGTLFAISELSWTATYRAHGQTDAHEYERPPVSVSAKTADAFAVFCSKIRPHLFFYDAGKWESLALRPGDPAAVSGATEAASNSYWAACHRFNTEDAISAKMAGKLGYHFSGGFPDGSEDPIRQPMDLLK